MDPVRNENGLEEEIDDGLEEGTRELVEEEESDDKREYDEDLHGSSDISAESEALIYGEEVDPDKEIKVGEGEGFQLPGEKDEESERTGCIPKLIKSRDTCIYYLWYWIYFIYHQEVEGEKGFWDRNLVCNRTIPGIISICFAFLLLYMFYGGLFMALLYICSIYQGYDLFEWQEYDYHNRNITLLYASS